jgi:hypothetical protein
VLDGPGQSFDVKQPPHVPPVHCSCPGSHQLPSAEHCEFDVHVFGVHVPSLVVPLHVPVPDVQSAFA